jgi:hypothetical protein
MADQKKRSASERADPSPVREQFEKREREPGRPTSAGRRNTMQPELERDLPDDDGAPGGHAGASRAEHVLRPRKKKRIA